MRTSLPTRAAHFKTQDLVSSLTMPKLKLERGGDDGRSRAARTASKLETRRASGAGPEEPWHQHVCHYSRGARCRTWGMSGVLNTLVRVLENSYVMCGPGTMAPSYPGLAHMPQEPGRTSRDSAKPDLVKSSCGHPAHSGAIPEQNELQRGSKH